MKKTIYMISNMKLDIDVNRIILCLVILMLFGNVSYAQSDEGTPEDWAKYDDMEVSILTVEGSSDLPSSFGHTTLRFRDASKELDITMNFGAYKFGGSNYYFNFFKGNIRYFVRRQLWVSFLRRAKKENRNLYEQILDLDSRQKYKLIKNIETYFKDGQDYKYDFFLKNCTTITRDVIEDNLDNQLVYRDIKPPFTYRQLLDLTLKHYLWTKLGIDLIIGTNTDYITTKREQMFLPKFFMDYMNVATVDGIPIVKEKKVLLTAEFQNTSPFYKTPLFVGWLLVFIEIILLLLAFRKGNPMVVWIYDKIWFTFWGVFSFFLLLLWFAANHYAWDDNWNILWTNPLLLFLAFRSLKTPDVFTSIILILELVLVLACLLGWNLIPQQFNIVLIPLLIVFCMKYIRYLLQYFKQKNPI